MSRNQQTIVAVLGLAVVLVYGCLGAYSLIYLTQRVPTQTAGSVQPPGAPPAAPSPTLCPTSTPTPILPSLTPEPPRPTNTRVIPPAGPVLVPPTPSAASSPTHAPYLTPPPQVTYTVGSSPTPPPQVTYTAAPSPTRPPSPPPSPTVDTRCVDNENAYHQQMLADIEAQYEPLLSWIEYEMEQAERDRDDMRMQELQSEYEMCENMKAADMNAENARHQAALDACG